MPSIQSVLRAEVITEVVSRIAATNTTLLTMFEMGPGGRAVRPVGHRFGSYDVFNNSRYTGPASAPGDAATRINRQKAGNVPYTIARTHPSIWLPAEEIHNLRPIGGPSSQFDEGGASYIAQQERYLGQTIGNHRTLLLQGMLRGALYAHQNGNEIYWNHTSSGAVMTMDFRMPAGNKSQLNMLGTGNIIDTSWDNPTANIPKHLTDINAAFQVLAGSQLNMVMVTSAVWQNVINNDYVVTQAGVANTAFDEFERRIGTNPDGSPINQFRGRLRCLPWIEWVIMDEGVEIGPDGSATYTKHIGDSNAAFLPTPRPQLFQMLEGSEPVSDREGAPQVVRTGTYAWAVNSSNPTGTTLFALDNAIPAAYVPAAYAYGTVVF